MPRLSALVKAAAGALALCLVMVTVTSAQGNGIPERLSRIEALLGKIVESIMPAPPAVENTTRLLLPFVSNQAGFDTGVSVSNTGLDSSGIVGKGGTCTVRYYGQATGGGAVPAPQTTNAAIPVGGQLVFTLSGGGSFGITGAPGFQGYIEIDCAFPFAHGFGFLSDLGARNLAATIPVLVLPTHRSAPESAGQ